MKLLQETSEWKVPTPNHIYIFSDSTTKIVGYIKEGTKVAIKFPKPMSFDKRRRTFTPVKARDYDLTAFNT